MDEYFIIWTPEYQRMLQFWVGAMQQYEIPFDQWGTFFYLVWLSLITGRCTQFFILPTHWWHTVVEYLRRQA